MTDWRPYAATLVATLKDKRVLSAGWESAFAGTPRHVFVPRFWDDDGNYFDANDERTWLASAYRDESLVVRRAEVPGTDMVWPISSSSRPSLMAQMLSLLDVEDGNTVLEIGTGTGFNAALLCHRLGDANVASIDIDADLVDTSRERLAELKYRPHLVVGDGAAGFPDAAPYSRIIATAGVQSIPSTWVTQLDADGILLADVRGNLASHLVKLHKRKGNAASGRVLADPGHFMWLRADVENPLRAGGQMGSSIDVGDPQPRPTHVGPSLLDEAGMRFLVQLAIPDMALPGEMTYGDKRCVFVRTDEDDSWVMVFPRAGGGHEVAQGGRRRMWDIVESVAKLWDDAGKPEPDQFGLTVHDDGRQYLWLDDPDGPRSWPMPLR